MGIAPDYLLIGHVTADLTPQGRVAGGTVSYAVRTAHAFGLHVAVLTSTMPDDPVLDEIRPYAHELIVLPATETTTYENIYTSEGRVQYVRGVAAPIEPADIPAHFRQAKVVHLAPIAGEINPSIAALFAPEANVLLTLQGWLRRWDADGRVHFKHWFDPEALQHMDIVVFSEEDIVESPQMEQEFHSAVEHVFVTRAEKGGTHYHWGVPRQFSTNPVEAVNPTGAGDIFATSLLASLFNLGNDFERATQVACALGAHAVTRVGLVSAPTPEEAAAALAEVGRA
ncbi:MAG TPA: PfkB family carbohydrate kinase [Candidatus Limnocylindrales bacterium]|nr:PfkB family carbohydrate kinase [Candidatus Limnocylindrales bacterium]